MRLMGHYPLLSTLISTLTMYIISGTVNTIKFENSALHLVFTQYEQYCNVFGMRCGMSVCMYTHTS